jgi:putative membrane protein
MFNDILNSSPEFDKSKDLSLSDYLAIERTKLANERTLLAYTRSSLYLLLGGIAFIQLQGYDNLKWLGYLSLCLSVVIMAIGMLRFFFLKKRLKRYYSEKEIGTRKNHL